MPSVRPRYPENEAHTTMASAMPMQSGNDVRVAIVSGSAALASIAEAHGERTINETLLRENQESTMKCLTRGILPGVLHSSNPETDSPLFYLEQNVAKNAASLFATFGRELRSMILWCTLFMG